MLSVLALTLYGLSYKCASTLYEDKVYWQVKWEGEERDLAHKAFKPGHLSLGSQLCCVLKYHTTERRDLLNSHATYTTVAYDHFWWENVLCFCPLIWQNATTSLEWLIYLLWCNVSCEKCSWQMRLTLNDDDLYITVIKGKQIKAIYGQIWGNDKWQNYFILMWHIKFCFENTVMW